MGIALCYKIALIATPHPPDTNMTWVWVQSIVNVDTFSPPRYRVCSVSLCFGKSLYQFFDNSPLLYLLGYWINLPIFNKYFSLTFPPLAFWVYFLGKPAWSSSSSVDLFFLILAFLFLICKYSFLFSFVLFCFGFYRYSITVVCLFSPSLHPTPAEPTSLPCLHPPPWFCPYVLYNSSCNPLFPLSPPHSLLAIVRLFLTSMSLVIFCVLFSFVDYVPVKGEIIWYLSLTTWLISLSIMLSSSIHAVAKGISLTNYAFQFYNFHFIL